MFARVLAVFTALYDARGACWEAVDAVPSDTPLHALVSGASQALDLAEDHLTQRRTLEGRERILQAATLLAEAASLSDESVVSAAYLQTLETLHRSEFLPETP